MKHVKVKTEIRKKQITDAALDIIAESGLNGLTIEAIASRIGIAGSSIYRHFTGKEEILDSILTRVENNLESILRESCSRHDPAEVCLKSIFLNHIDFLEKHKGLPRFVFSEEVYLGNGKNALRIRKIIKRYMEGISQVLRKGIENGEFCERLDETAAAAAMLGLIQSTALQWGLFRYSFSPKRRGEKLWKVYSEGILLR